MALDYVKARKLAEELMVASAPRYQATAKRLWAMLEPPLTMAEILELIPAPTVKARADMLGISRQAYYNLRSGSCLPAAATRERLARLTGVPAEAMRNGR